MKKIAIPTNESGELNSHFGHSKFFSIFEIENRSITSEKQVIPPPHKPGVLPMWLSKMEITDVLAGGIGDRAKKIFNNRGINVISGAPTINVKKLVEGFIDNSIEFKENNCHHH